jgi:8-oxo-dGTP diphosphatase
MSHSITEIRAAGTVLWRRRDRVHELALVHRPRYDDWSFPKGKLDRHEPLPAAAVRESVEETGHEVRLGAVLGEVRYDVPDGRKVVRYWGGEALGGTFVPNHETDELRWLTADEARTLLSYEHDVEILHRFEEIGPPTATVLLTRHAKAGSRAQWEGDDDLRPLSGSGREQVRQLTTFLPLFGPDRIVTAPPLRCRDTVVPLSELLGLPIAEEPLLGERDYWPDPASGLARFCELAAKPGVTLVSSQGGVIPDVVAALVEASPRSHGVDPDTVAAKKGSTWVLGFNGSELRSADYYPHPTGD